MARKTRRQYSKWLCQNCGRYKTRMRVLYGCDCRGDEISRSGRLAGSDVPNWFDGFNVRRVLTDEEVTIIFRRQQAEIMAATIDG